MAKRVRVRDYGRVEHNDPRLWPVPSVEGKVCRLHWAAASALAALQQAWNDAGHLGLLLCCSGWRPHRWRSRAHYESEMVRRYGSVAKGRVWMAYDSPHETGLACDFGSLGLWPTRNTVARQRRSELHRWLVDHAGDCGWVPYSAEPWHWECLVTPEVWALPGPEAT